MSGNGSGAAKCCDFCPTGRPAYNYPARDFVARMALVDPATGHTVSESFHSKGAWSACLECAELIEADDCDGLSARRNALAGPHPELGELEQRILREIVAEAHRAFFAARTGERVRV